MPPTPPAGAATKARHVALFRGINVGRAKRVAMADLRALIERLGYGDVRTLLNSGNVVFGAPGVAAGDAASRIEKALASKLSVASRVTVLRATEIDSIVKDNPLLDVSDDPSRLMVAFLANPADRARLAPMTRQRWTPDAIALGRRVAYLWCPRGMLESPVAKEVGRVLGDAVTTRNWATVLKIHDLTRTGGRPEP